MTDKDLEARRTPVCSLTYTNEDDGIYMECSCGWITSFGHNPTVAEVVHRERQHFIEKHGEKR